MLVEKCIKLNLVLSHGGGGAGRRGGDGKWLQDYYQPTLLTHTHTHRGTPTHTHSHTPQLPDKSLRSLRRLD